MNVFVETIDGVQEILAICPCCGDIFRLVEGKFIFPKKPSSPSEYMELVALENRLTYKDDRLTVSEQRFEQKLKDQRQMLVKQGRRQAKRRLKKIDPTFSARDIDPQDVKVIFEPVEYIIFHGLNSVNGVKFVEFVSRTPETTAQETIVKAIDKTIRRGDVKFETLHMRHDGSFEIKKA